MEKINYKVTIIGLGNILMSDDGLGATVIKQLKQETWSREILIVDCGTCPLVYLEQLSTSQHVIVIDAIKKGKPAGTIYHFNLAKHRSKNRLKRTTHNYSLPQVIALAREINNLPHTVIYYGIEPANLNLGTELSHPLRQSIPKLIRLIKKQINQLSKK
ncbi:hydrogenase maturation protease [Halanaerobacter jeridensis]|uniref:Hydrogenase maturation protease n=1 Tax=Halanaerobacter jeridensis TaxID=706427 RepID=A0A938XNX9_9FIRM|nr:hydrogenase maturation protease [Halanaerobacter jeridensis]MBM7556348.1 hydrogenase maturation protease [Halanaerobacter jeridensis]